MEWGPPARWAVANESAAAAEIVLQDMVSFGLEPRLIDSFVWDEYIAQNRAAIHKAHPEIQSLPASVINFGEGQSVVGHSVPIVEESDRKALTVAMNNGGRMPGQKIAGWEAYMWFVRVSSHPPSDSHHIVRMPRSFQISMTHLRLQEPPKPAEEAVAYPTLHGGCQTRVRSGVYGCEELR